MKWGWVFLKRTRIFTGIQFTRHCIEFIVVKTNKMVRSNSNVILTRQTCGKRSSMVAGSKRRVLAFHFSVRILYVFLMSKCRGVSDLGLCTFLVITKRMQLRSGDFRFKNTFYRIICRKLPLHNRTLFVSAGKVYKPRPDSPLHFDILDI